MDGPSWWLHAMSDITGNDDLQKDDLKQAALDYHSLEPKGKIKVTATKPMVTQRDLALAYSPGVAFACEAIAADPRMASEYTARGNLVAVITNGTAVLGLGDIGPLAGKPVMEGKGVLFQKFAGIDVFDIELNERDPDKLVDIIAAMEPTFGGINLEDIKAPECFIVERKLRERMNIPVFHDDQHGTAIIVGAAILNALEVAGKKIEDVRLATAGAGAAGIACLDMLVALGLKAENILAFDREGVLYTGRGQMDPDKARYARDTAKRTLAEIVDGADIFLGLSAGGVLRLRWWRRWRRRRSSWRWPIRIRKYCRNTPRQCARTASSPPAVRTIRTRSTTRCASRTSSAARWTWARRKSTKR
jgi:malate dehydrogenase (oxaloacetate-decarboxylating)(NADP+)